MTNPVNLRSLLENNFPSFSTTTTATEKITASWTPPKAQLNSPQFASSQRTTSQRTIPSFGSMLEQRSSTEQHADALKRMQDRIEAMGTSVSEMANAVNTLDMQSTNATNNAALFTSIKELLLEQLDRQSTAFAERISSVEKRIQEAQDTQQQMHSQQLEQLKKIDKVVSQNTASIKAMTKQITTLSKSIEKVTNTQRTKLSNVEALSDKQYAKLAKDVEDAHCDTLEAIDRKLKQQQSDIASTISNAFEQLLRDHEQSEHAVEKQLEALTHAIMHAQQQLQDEAATNAYEHTESECDLNGNSEPAADAEQQEIDVFNFQAKVHDGGGERQSQKRRRYASRP